MSTLSAALAVKEIAKKGVFADSPSSGVDEYMAKQAVREAAPDALDWIAEALPWMKKQAAQISEALTLAKGQPRAGQYADFIAYLEEQLTTANVLIAQAEGTEQKEGVTR